eukprot:364358-Chlamydomonas_euryale.AAC.4
MQWQTRAALPYVARNLNEVQYGTDCVGREGRGSQRCAGATLTQRRPRFAFGAGRLGAGSGQTTGTGGWKYWRTCPCLPPRRP